MLRIEFIIYGDINQTSGGYYYDREFIRALKFRGHRVTISKAADGQTGRAETDLYIIDELCHPDFFRTKHFKRLRTNTPLVGMVHHLAADEGRPFFDRIKHLVMERSFLNAMDFIVFNSQSTRESARKKGLYKGPSAIAVPGRSNTGGNRKPGGNAGPLQLIFLGNLIPRKGLHHLLLALSGLPDIPFGFTIAGDDTVDPAYTRRIKRLIKRRRLEDRVILKGPVSNDQKKKILENADLMLMPSSHEGYGIAYVEAMGHGVIPVAGISGGAGEIIRHGENGFLVNPKNPMEIISILSQIYESPGWKNQLSSSARQRWQAHPLWEDTFQPVITALENLISTDLSHIHPAKTVCS